MFCLFLYLIMQGVVVGPKVKGIVDKCTVKEFYVFTINTGFNA